MELEPLIIINLSGGLLIALIVWWFWIYKSGGVAVGEGAVTILVENGIYTPSRIRLPAGQGVLLHFIRKDATPCAAMVVFEDFAISEELPLNKPKDIVLPPLEAGEYAFTCQMRMYQGALIVSASA